MNYLFWPLTFWKTVIATTGALRPYRTVTFDTLKIYTKAHGSKTMNLVINFENDDEWILSDNIKTLLQYGIGKFYAFPFFFSFAGDF